MNIFKALNWENSTYNIFSKTNEERIWKNDPDLGMSLLSTQCSVKKILYQKGPSQGLPGQLSQIRSPLQPRAKQRAGVIV